MSCESNLESFVWRPDLSYNFHESIEVNDIVFIVFILNYIAKSCENTFFFSKWIGIDPHSLRVDPPLRLIGYIWYYV